MTVYDLAFAWNWEYDSDFVACLEAACARCELSLLLVTPSNLADTVECLSSNQTRCYALYDRASDIDDNYLPLVEWASQRQALHINEYYTARRAWDKATMHLEFIAAGLHTPHTIILPPYDDQPEFPKPDLAPLGEQFSIKPAHGGGGSGVVNRATAWSQVQTARAAESSDKYLLQEWITPAMLEGKRAWFRPIYACGQVFVNWWDDQTHIYTPVTSEEEVRLGLGQVREMVLTIAQVCGLQIFSTEIALAKDGRWLSVDYVNDPIDLRLQSRAPEGVPDTVVAGVAESLAAFVAQRVHPILRQACVADIPAMTALMVELGRPDSPTPDVYEHHLTDPDHIALVAELDGRIVGVLLGALRRRPNLTRPELWISELSVSASARGRGLGKLLTQQAITQARARDCFRIVLESSHHRKPAHQLYRSLNFDERGVYFTLEL